MSKRAARPRSTWTQSQRDKHNARQQRWRAEHPDKTAVIQLRGTMVRGLVLAGVEREVARRRARKRFPLPPEAA